jgi:ComF family protein
MNATPRAIWNDFVSLIYPRFCEACGEGLVKGESLFCTACLRDLPRTHFHQLPDHALARKFRGRLPVAHALAFLKFRKGGKVQQILHSLKYRNRPEIGFRLGVVYGLELVQDEAVMGYEVIVSVPLHPSRLRQRGYNQSDEWAKGLSNALGIPFKDNVIRRLKKTQTQTERTKLSRWENVKEIFEVVSPAQVTGKKVLLVDDVVTTGATLEACSVALLQAGCVEISLLCLAAAN